MTDEDPKYDFAEPERLPVRGGRVWHRLSGPNLPKAAVYIRFGRAVDGRLVCTGLHVGDPDGAAEVTATDLRRVPLAKVLGDLASYLTDEGYQPDPRVWLSQSTGRAIMRRVYSDMVAKHAAPFAPRTRPGPKGLPAEHFKRIADQYRAALAAAPGRPVQHLASQLQVPEPTVRRWLQRARRDGLLAQAPPGKAGEVPGNAEPKRGGSGRR